jgi:two-component system cell cycle sensor histidine kinase PleC
MMEVRATSGGCTLIRAVDTDLPAVIADERALKQILLNLASNAVKFTPPGGRLTIFCHLDSAGEIRLGMSDTGVGIARDDLPSVFENFGQGRHDVVTADKGTGLGLPIVKGLAECHGGRVELQSEVGEGTTVTVILPATRVSVRAPLREAS